MMKMKDGFLRAAAATPEIRTGDPGFNARQIISLLTAAAEKDVSVIVFPELCITGSTCGDLFLSGLLLDGAEQALAFIAEKTAQLDILAVIGLPVEFDGRLYSCAAVIKNGAVLGIVPKENIPGFSETHEPRYFTSGKGVEYYTERFGGVFFGSQLFECSNIPGLIIGIEISGDLWAVNSPSALLAQSGATLICNPSAFAEAAGRDGFRRLFVSSQSAKLLCGYIYAEAGTGESTQDLVFAGHNIIAENGTVLSESKRFTTGFVYNDIDLDRIISERRSVNTFIISDTGIPRTGFELPVKALDLVRTFRKNPFVPSGTKEINKRCGDILDIQAAGLLTLLKNINCRNTIIGLSGGLDSTAALIAAVRAYDMLGVSRTHITAVTMPCFGTTKRTKNNALSLAKAYGVTVKEIDITASVKQHFADIGLDENNGGVAYENAQARERTQVLMDYANMNGGIVLGTGDLSELALGWATYNGDHMSMYGINGSVPKTLMRHIVRYESETADDGVLSDVLKDILDTPVSPELLPPSDGEISQKTEETVGPYELHDFFLYYFIRCRFSPSKIFRLAVKAFEGDYDTDTVKKWLKVFVKRFFTQQFKRSCLPGSPKTGSVSLSPRGGLNMPGDASYSLWLDDVE